MNYSKSRARRVSLLIPLVVWSVAAVMSWPLGPLTTRVYAEERENKEFLIKTPWGSFEAQKTLDPSHIGLPLYPGAKFVKDNDSGTVTLNLSLSGQPPIRILAGKFRTPDTVEKVREFYRKNLGAAVTKYTEKTSEGSEAFEMRRKSLIQAVELKSVDGATEIHLTRIEGVNEKTN